MFQMENEKIGLHLGTAETFCTEGGRFTMSGIHLPLGGLGCDLNETCSTVMSNVFFTLYL